MRKLWITAFAVAAAGLLFGETAVTAQPVYRFSVKVGIDRASVDSLGGRERVIRLTENMFRKINRAFNYDGRFAARHLFQVDWDAFYIYDGLSTDEVRKPHPDHDYLVVMDGYKSDPREQGGGWHGDEIQTVYHARTHNDRFNSPFEQGAIDGIIHEFGHARGVPDLYAMQVDADKNPVNGEPFTAVRCIMNYCYGEEHWSDYAVNMINLSDGRNIDIDDLVSYAAPQKIEIVLRDADGSRVDKAAIRCYPVRWYTYSVAPQPAVKGRTGRDGCCTFDTDALFMPEKEFGRRYCNYLIEAEYDGIKAYGWIPLYELQNAWFDGQNAYRLELRLKRDCKITRDITPLR